MESEINTNEERLKRIISEYEEVNRNLQRYLDESRRNLREANGRRVLVEANIEWYNKLPWYRKIFVFRI